MLGSYSWNNIRVQIKVQARWYAKVNGTDFIWQQGVRERNWEIEKGERDRIRKREGGEREREKDRLFSPPHVAPTVSSWLFFWSSWCWGFPSALLEAPLLYSPSPGYPEPFPQFGMACVCVSSFFLYWSLRWWEFLSKIGYPDLPHQVWHLPVGASVLFPQSAQWDLVQCASSIPFLVR